MVVALRNFLYDRGLLKTHHVSATVLSIGNITAGGTGKTPLVIWLCSLLKQKQIPHAILTRGYKSGKTKLTDEPAILAKSCPEAKLIINPNRFEGAQKAIEKFGSKVLVMDDGFQHRRLARELDILTIDATCPFGYGKILPAGLLREPKENLKRADAVIITRSNQVSGETLSEIIEKIQLIKPDIVIAKAVHAPVCVKLIKDKEIDIAQLREKKIFAFCGIGNPDAFINSLKELQLEIAGSKIYNDHYEYNSTDIVDIYENAIELNAEVILTTQKDWVKTTLLARQKDDVLFAYLEVKLEFPGGAGKIADLIDEVLNRQKT